MTSKLKAFHNRYECVAAHSKEEAMAFAKALPWYEGDEEAAEGDGWSVLSSEMVVRNEDVEPEGTVGEILAESDKVRLLWCSNP